MHEQIKLWLQLTRSKGIIRRYFVVNGFDGALTMLGLVTGFYLTGNSALGVMISACLGAAIALGMSGLSSAYLSESAERKKELADLESAMVADLSDSAHADAARTIPWLIALVNGSAPLLISLIIISPLMLTHYGWQTTVDPLLAAMASAFICIFALGCYLGRVSGTGWLISGIKTTVIAIATVLIILLVGN